MTGRTNPDNSRPEVPAAGARGHTRRMQTWLAAVTLAVGLMLLAFMVVVEDEPGALPLLLVLVGGGWLSLIKRKRAGRT